MKTKYFYSDFIGAVAMIAANKIRRIRETSPLFLGMMGLMLWVLFSCSIVDLDKVRVVITPSSAQITTDSSTKLTVNVIGASIDEGSSILWEASGSSNVSLQTNSNTVTVLGKTQGVAVITATVSVGGNTYVATARVEVFLPKEFSSIIRTGIIPNDLPLYDQASREIFSGYPAGIAVVAKYVSNAASGNGFAFANAATNVDAVLKGISNASAANLYVVLIAPGTYTQATMSMRNHVVIVGGVSHGGDIASLRVASMTNTSLTTLSGGGTHRVFSNVNITNTARLYGVTIANGYIGGNSGGGMYNENSSPVLNRVAIVNNTTTSVGGGMYNQDSSPELIDVNFSNNSARQGGGYV